jgi:hypothetical protein
MDLEHLIAIEDAKDVHVGQPHEDLADADRIADKASREATSHAVRLTAPPSRSADPVPPSDPKLPIGCGRRLL